MKVLFGMFIVAGSGKTNGHVASRNRGGAYVRTRVTPSNPQTAAQSAVRSSFGGFAQGWAGLTEAQRAGWNNAVQDWQTTDVFGDLRAPSGINLYMKLNQNLTNIGEAAISSVPGLGSPDAPILGTLTAAETGNTLTLAHTPTSADTEYLIEATAPVSPGKSFVKNKFRVITHVPGNQASPIDLETAYVAKFGNLVAGQKVFVRVKPILVANGQAGPGQTAMAIIGA